MITGSKGFLGKNLIHELHNQKYNDIFEYDIDTDRLILDEYCREAEFIFHLAGVNRPLELIKGELYMKILAENQLEYNNRIKINFDGGNLSSDTGIILLKEFASKIGFEEVVEDIFKTNDSASTRTHKDKENLLQKIYQTVSGYFQDDDSDELTNDPVFKSIVNKNSLASQPTMSRFFNRMDKDTYSQLEKITEIMRQRMYSLKEPDNVLLDIDSTLFSTYGEQDGNAFNYHYSGNGYHPLLCYDGLTGDLLKVELRHGNVYTSKGSDAFIKPLLDEYMEKYRYFIYPISQQ